MREILCRAAGLPGAKLDVAPDNYPSLRSISVPRLFTSETDDGDVDQRGSKSQTGNLTKNPRTILHFCSVTAKGDDNPRWQDITSYAFLIRATSTVHCRLLDVVCCLGWILPLWSEARGAVICGLLKNIEHLLFQQHAHQKHPVHARRLQLKSAIECCCGCGLFCPCLHRSRALRADPLGVTSVRSHRMNGKVGTPRGPTCPEIRKTCPEIRKTCPEIPWSFNITKARNNTISRRNCWSNHIQRRVQK